MGGCKAQLERELKSLSGGACTGGWVDGGVLRCSVSVCVCVYVCAGVVGWGPLCRTDLDCADPPTMHP